MIAWLALCAFAEDVGAPPESDYAGVEAKRSLPGGLTAFAQVQSRGAFNNLASTNPLLDGQIVGRLGGTNGVVPDPETLAVYTEFRTVGFVDWHPKWLGGRAGIGGAFEVDFAFGDKAYGVGGNVGGGFGGDQVNLQTRRLYASFRPFVGKHDLHLVLGLQFVGDGVNDPSAVGPDGLIRSGGRLMIFGSEMAGLAAYGRIKSDWGDHLRYRLGAFTLIEGGSAKPDDAWLAVGDLEWRPTYGLQVGIHAWYLQDRTGGDDPPIGVGPSSALSELQGGPKLDPYDGQLPPDGAEVLADLAWIGADAGYNPSLTEGPVGVSGSAFANVGRLYAPVVQDDQVLGLLANVEVRGRYAPGEGSVIRGEVLYTSGDDADTGRYTGVVTGNSYGVAGAVHATHGTLLLFPDPRSINKMVAVVSDISGAGQGVIGLTGSVGYDPVPSRVNVTAHFGHARTAAGPAWGTELGGKVVVKPLPFCDVGLYGGYVIPGAASNLTTAPWIVYGALDWVVF